MRATCTKTGSLNAGLWYYLPHLRSSVYKSLLASKHDSHLITNILRQPIFTKHIFILFQPTLMASIQVRSEPRNNELLWLQRANNHRSLSIFNGTLNDVPIKARRCDERFWHAIDNLENGEIPPEVFNHITEAGFGGVFQTKYHRLDWGLITALVERWRPETHTFHFPVGEATITLQDVQVLWGLPIDGPVVSGTWLCMDKEQWMYTCYEHLGFVPDEAEIDGGRIKISTLLEHLEDPLEDNEVAYRQRAKMYLLALFAGHLFVDSSQYDVSLNFLENLNDLSRAGRKSWGGAVIAHLYRNLCKATKQDCKGIQGALLLLQYWAFERMPHIAPGIIRAEEYNYDHCYAARWDATLKHTDTPSHVLVTYRSAFTALTPQQFKWTPYDEIIHLLPNDCRDGQAIWSYSGWVIFWSTVEPHLAHRVSRQFGYIQSIPDPFGLLTPQRHIELHAIQRIGGRGTDWVHKLRDYVDFWNHRRDRIFVGEAGVTTTPDYMQWYFERTVLCIRNPNEPGPPNQYPEWGGLQQFYHEGFREIQHRAQQAINRDPTQNPMLQDFVHLPRQMMQFGHAEERMNYASQNFEFPASAYYPVPPGGAFYSGSGNPSNYPGSYYGGTSNPGTSRPSNHLVFRTPSPNMNCPGTPSSFNLFNIPNNALAPDIQFTADFHPEMGRRMGHVSPIPMANWSTAGTSRNLDMNEPEEHLPFTNLGANDDEDDEDDEPEEHLYRNARARRQTRRPPCGTGGHR